MSDQGKSIREYLPGNERQTQRSYSPAVITTGGRTIYLAGFGGATDETGRSLAGDFDGQVRTAFNNIRKTLERAGATLENVVTMTVFVTDIKNGNRFVEIRKEFFPGGRYPGSALIGIKELARPEMMVEIQAIAVAD
ncbi:MAG: RidA family protein [Deltaproteobacteria bacterium]|nr:RidA family protein [Deltaproteobacteria bacterium]